MVKAPRLRRFTLQKKAPSCRCTGYQVRNLDSVEMTNPFTKATLAELFRFTAITATGLRSITRVHTFSKNLGATPKFYAPER